LGLGATHAFADIAEAAEFARSITNGQGANSAVVSTDVVTGEQVAAAFKAVGKKPAPWWSPEWRPQGVVGIPVNLLELTTLQKRIQGALFGASNPPSTSPPGPHVPRRANSSSTS